METNQDPEYVALLKRQAQVEADMAYVRGQRDQARHDLMHDPELIEVLRAKAWRKTGTVVQRIEDGRVVGHPEGWPDGVDADLEIEKHVDSKMPKAPQSSEPSEADSKFVQQFRERINHATD
ncbi:MAG: hypothetical protein AAGI37_04840 [Planctomycetota bacterium]